MAQLSLCMMVKNEGKTLARAIRSMPESEIIIGVDKSSTDNTAKVAKKYADKYFEFDWCDNFSLIRNKTLELATNTWVCWMDGHEYISKKSRVYLENLDQIPEYVDSVNCRLSILDANKKEILYFYSTKLLRNGHFKFQNKVHNKPVRLHENGSMTATAKEIEILHHRSDELERQRSEQRRRLNIKSHLEALKVDPCNSRELMYLGQGYLERGEFDKGLKVLIRQLKVSKWAEERYQVRIYISSVQIDRGMFNEALGTLWPCEREDIRRAEHYILRGDAFFGLGQTYNAERCYLQALATPLPVSPMFILPHYYTWLPYQRLCDLHVFAGNHDKSMSYAVKLKKYRPDLAGVAMAQLSDKKQEKG